MMTEGVMVMMAATMNVKAERMVDGRVDRACIKVVYEAIIIGGKGGKSGCAEVADGDSIGVEGL
jgi:hypothetical protein